MNTNPTAYEAASEMAAPRICSMGIRMKERTAHITEMTAIETVVILIPVTPRDEERTLYTVCMKRRTDARAKTSTRSGIMAYPAP